MAALFRLTLGIDVGCDAAWTFTLRTAAGAPIGILGATAALTLRGFPTEPPLVTVTSTPTDAGAVSFGVALPAPSGLNAETLAEAQGGGVPLELSLDPPGLPQVTVASTAALQALDTTGRLLGQLVFVEAGQGALFAWSPGSVLTPNGSTVVATSSAGPAGNWLLCGTVRAVVTAGALAALAGLSSVYWDLAVQWGNGATTKLFEGRLDLEPTLSAMALLLPTPAPATDVVRVNATGADGAQASPYAAHPGETVVVDTSLGSVVVAVPNLPLGASLTVQHDATSSLATSTVTVSGPPGVDLGEPPPNNGSFAPSVVFGGPTGGGEQARGTTLRWTNGGSSGGYLLG